MPTNVPAYAARVKTIGSSGLTADVNADSAQLKEVSDFVNALPADVAQQLGDHDNRLQALEDAAPGGSSGPEQRSGNVLAFDADADYSEISGGTFTVDLAGRAAGVTTTARLGASCTAIALPSATFSRLGSGMFVAGAANLYCFLSFETTGKIFYTVTPHA